MAVDETTKTPYEKIFKKLTAGSRPTYKVVYADAALGFPLRLDLYVPVLLVRPNRTSLALEPGNKENSGSNCQKGTKETDGPEGGNERSDGELWVLIKTMSPASAATRPKRTSEKTKGLRRMFR